MCELTEISEADSGELMSIYEEEDMESTAEINGEFRKVTVLGTDATKVPFPSYNFHRYSICKRLVTKHQIGQKILMRYDSGGSGSIKFEAKWGDEDGIKFSGGIEVEAHDDNGNYASVRAEQDSDGKGKVEVSAGHKEDCFAIIGKI